MGIVHGVVVVLCAGLGAGFLNIEYCIIATCEI